MSYLVMTATLKVLFMKILEKKKYKRKCVKDGDFCEISSYFQGILSLVA